MEGQNQQQLGKEPILKLLMKYSVPAIIGMLVNALYTVVDRIFIGNIPNVGPLAITGVGVTLPISTIILGFGMLIGIGATTNISIKLGEKNRQDAEKLVGNTISLSIVIGLILTVFGLVFCDKILNLFGTSENTLHFAKEFITIILYGTVFNLLGFSMYSTLRGDGNPKLAAKILITGCVVNIILNPIFIFIFNMGIKGSAIATVISQILTSVWTIMYYTIGKSNLKLKLENLKLDSRLVKLVFSIGAAPFLMQIAASFVQVISNNALRQYGGELAIGAMATIASIATMILMPIFGINQGAQPIIGYNFGAKQYDRVKKTFLYSTAVSTVILLAGYLVIQAFPTFVVGLFNKDPEFMDITVKGMRIYILVLPIIGVSIMGSNLFQSIGLAKTAILLSLLRQLILLVPMLFILPKFLSLTGVWLAQPLSDIIATAITVWLLIVEFKNLSGPAPEPEDNDSVEVVA